MGEIKIKSGNLFEGELEQGSLGTSAGQEYPTTTRVRTKKPGVNLQAGTYTIDCVGATRGVVVYVYNKDSSWDKESSSKNWQAMPLTFSLSSEKLVRFAFRKTGDSDILPSEITDIQILEGTYTSETIPEYQPYFLNRPAHQITNGQFVDIPTHHYTNGRWQGELTSQSPLEFKATGQSLLDWRVDGKTSENLFNINGEHISVSRKGIQCFVVDDDKLVVQIISPGGTTRITYPNNFYNPNAYTVSVKLTGELTGIRFLSTSPFPGGTYNATYKAYFKSMTLNDGIYTITVSPTETTTIGFVVMGADDAQNPGTVEDIQILSGTYTSSTIPPYEPYGGVGDWDETAQRYKIPVTVNGVTTTLYTDHQLLDGDSIDFATDQTAIPIATGNNTLTVDTAVKPSKVFVKFEG